MTWPCGAVVPFDFMMASSAKPGTIISFRNLVAYHSQKAEEGSAVAMTGAIPGTANPIVNFEFVHFGRNGAPVGAAGAFSPAVRLQNVGNSFFVNVQCYGSINYALGKTNGRNGSCVSSNGSSGHLSFGPNFVLTSFYNMDVAVLIGDGTHAYV